MLREFGVPVFFLIVAMVALQRRWIVPGAELERKQKLLESEAAYREQLRIEERDRAVRAEQRLAANTKAIRLLAETLKAVEDELERRARRDG